MYFPGMAYWVALANLPTGAEMEALVEDFLLGLGLDPGPGDHG